MAGGLPERDSKHCRPPSIGVMAFLHTLNRPFSRGLAVFAGSWDLDAVEHICTPTTPGSSLVIDTLVHLINKSLVVAEEQEGWEGDTAEVRYRLLDTTHQYALEKLQQDGSLQQ